MGAEKGTGQGFPRADAFLRFLRDAADEYWQVTWMESLTRKGWPKGRPAWRALDVRGPEEAKDMAGSMEPKCKRCGAEGECWQGICSVCRAAAVKGGKAAKAARGAGTQAGSAHGQSRVEGPPPPSPHPPQGQAVEDAIIPAGVAPAEKVAGGGGNGQRATGAPARRGCVGQLDMFTASSGLGPKGIRVQVSRAIGDFLAQGAAVVHAMCDLYAHGCVEVEDE